MRRRYRPAKLISLGDVLQKELKKRGIPVQFEDTRLRDIWEEAVGPVVAAQTRAESIKKHTLNVKVASSVWMQQLHFLRDDILQKVNRILTNDPIQKIKFTVGEIPVRSSEEKKPTGRETMSSLKERDKRMIEETTARLNDTELRDMLKRLMMKEISRRRLMEKQAGKDPRK